MKVALKLSIPLLLAISLLAAESAKTTTVKGYVLDSACAFTKRLKKPISGECGTIYWPIADTTPSASQNDKLLPFAGQTVTVSGKVFQRGGSNAIVISKIEPIVEKK